jgi:excisionase family DNA binding protein
MKGMKANLKKPEAVGGEALKKKWVLAIDRHPEANLTIKELAGILDVSRGKISRAIGNEELQFVKMGKEGTKSKIVIAKPDAKAWVKDFYTPAMDLTPPGRLLFQPGELQPGKPEKAFLVDIDQLKRAGKGKNQTTPECPK